MRSRQLGLSASIIKPSLCKLACTVQLFDPAKWGKMLFANSPQGSQSTWQSALCCVSTVTGRHACGCCESFFVFCFFNIEQLEVSIYIWTLIRPSSIKAFCIFPCLSTTFLYIYIFYQNMFSGPQLLPPLMCNTNKKGINLSELRSLREKLPSHVNSELN